MKKENKNFILNVAYQFVLYLFPLIIAPYISNVLGADGVGTYSYTYSIVSLFTLVAMLGINNYGNREIAKVRDDKTKLSQKFCSIFYLQLIMAAIVLTFYTVFVIFFTKDYKPIFIIQGLFLLATFLDINWLFFGLENFKIAITRNLVVKLISTGLIFMLVKTHDDLWKYTLIMGASTLFSQVYLFSHAFKYIHPMKQSLQQIFKNFKSCLILFVPVLAYSIYRIMDKTMLGWNSVTELGYYENAEKLINVPVAIITALGTVMLPHMAYEMHRRQNHYSQKIEASIKLASVLSAAMSVGIAIIACDIVIIMFGSEFEKSSSVILLLSPTIMFSAWANVIRTQYLIPAGRDKTYVRSAALGAIINFVSNSILIGRLGVVGACIGTILAEFSVMLYQVIAVRNDLDIKTYSKIILKDILRNFIIGFIVVLCSHIIEPIILRLTVRVIGFIILFILIYRKYIYYDFLGKTKAKRNDD